MEYAEYYEKFVHPVLSGQMDDYLDGMIQTIALRRKDAAPKIWEYKVGDKVRIKDAHPLYLNGHTATILKVNRTKVIVKLDDSASDRFTKWTRVTTPLANIEKV